MPRWLQFILNNPQFLLVAAFVVLPLLKTIFKAAAEAKARKDAEARRERREIDALRTGQAGPAPSAPRPGSARQELEAMAAQRRAEAARRTPARPARAASPPPLRTAAPPERVAQVRLPGGLVLEIPTAEPTPVPPPPPKQASRPGRGGPQRRGSEKPRRAETTPESARPMPRTPQPEPVAPLPVAAAARSSARVWLAGAALSREDWRRAVILREVLGPPVALR